MASEFEAMRRLAIDRYRSGDKISTICMELGMSRKWFYKWQRRFLTGENEWYTDQSKARKSSSRVVDKDLEERIIWIRKKLEKTKYAQIGAITIMYELEKMGVPHVPKILQINRVLKRNGLGRVREPYQPKNKLYPTLGVQRPGIREAMDFTPSYPIKGDGSTRSLNLIDTYSGRVKINICRTRTNDETIHLLIATWKVMGIPQYLQMDNDPAFSSHNMKPRNLSRLIRFLLSLGIELMYIPAYEPWRNGVVEKFNEAFKNFYYLDRWNDLEDLKRGAKRFEDFYNNHHRYSTRRGKTAIELEEEVAYQPNILGSNFNIKEKERIPLNPNGKLHFIRYIRSNRILNIFNEKFKVHEDLVYNYVMATIDIKKRCLEIRLKDEVAETMEYNVSA